MVTTRAMKNKAKYFKTNLTMNMKILQMSIHHHQIKSRLSITMHLCMFEPHFFVNCHPSRIKQGG